jgi:GNAT superfamily N-acetyltransferase
LPISMKFLPDSPTAGPSANLALDRSLADCVVGHDAECISKVHPMKLRIRPLTPDLWPALRDLFGKNGACNGCWCMYWRIGNAYRKKTRHANKAAFHEVVKKGPPPGLLAFHGEVPVGWCQLTPRNGLPWLDRAWRLKRVDDVPVWSISCFYVRKGYRRKGVTSALIAEAVKTAKRAGAPALEAYPLDADLTPSASGTGYLSTFARMGFKVVARRTLPRPIMRRDLQSRRVAG